jgi:exodeoxyribonuclease VII small subunit
MPAKKTESAPREPSFETALDRLEALVVQMEDGNLPLEELIERYEVGIKLVDYCSGKLAAAEQRIQVIAQKAGGRVELEDFSENQPPPPASGKASDVSLF